MMKRNHLTSTLILLLLSLWGSLAFGRDPDIDAVAKGAATVVEHPFEIYFVPSSGVLADATFRTMSKTNGPSAIARGLAAEFEKPRTQLRTIVVGGPSDGKTKQVLLDALKLVEGTPLTNLRLVFVGGAKVASEIESLAIAAGAEFKTAVKATSGKTSEPTR